MSTPVRPTGPTPPRSNVPGAEPTAAVDPTAVDPTVETDLERSGRAWMVLGVAALSAVLTGPGQTIGVSVFIDHFIEDLEITRPVVSFTYLIGTLCGGFAMPFVGRFIDQRGVRLAQVLIGVAFTLALINMSFVGGVVTLAIGFAGIRMFGQGALSLTAGVTVSLAFSKRRAFALGMFATATGMLMATVPLGLDLVIEAVGWRSAWRVAALVIALTVVPLGWFGLAQLPRRKATPPAVAGDAVETIDPHHATRSEALRTRSFWMLATAVGSSSMLATALNFHQVDLLGEAGLEAQEAAALFLPQAVGAVAVGLIGGSFSQRYGTRWLPAAAMGLLITAHLLAATVAPGLIVVLYAVVLGAGGGTVRLASSVMLPHWFGTAHLGSIQGVMTFVGVITSALGPFALAIVRDGFEAYQPAILLLMMLPVVALVLAIDPRNHRGRNQSAVFDAVG